MRQSKRWKAMFLAGVMTLSMCMGTTAFAEENKLKPETQEVSPSVTKVLEMAEGITVPSVKFSFTAEKVTTDAPSASVADISYSSADTKAAENGKLSVEKTGAITFTNGQKTGAAAFPHAGEYEYTVTETANTNTMSADETLTYSQDTYTMFVYVANVKDSDDLMIKEVVVKKGTVKTDEISFTNTYTKRGGSSEKDAASLVISKTTTGDYANESKDFTYTITFTKAVTESADVKEYVGKIGTEEVTCTIGEATTFYLHHGESLVFANLPAGTRYVVTEAGAEGYTPSVKVMENGAAITPDRTAGSGQSLSTAAANATNLVGEKANKAAYTNNYPAVPQTGVVVEYLPFILLLAVAGAALILMGMLKKKHSMQ